MARRLHRRGFQALVLFAAVVLALLGFRWLVAEPYLIPSGSMIPSLFVNDHILVNKTAYGVRWPFTSSWLVRWNTPERGDVVVFRSIEDDGVFMVKRVVGLEGDVVEYKEGHLYLNGEIVPITMAPESDTLKWLRSGGFQGSGELSDYEMTEEVLDGRAYVTMLRQGVYHQDLDPTTVPDGHFLVLGDNRDNSFDSRFWGTVPFDNLMGEVLLVWLSCEKMLTSLNPFCDPTTVRWNRLFYRVQ